MAHDSASRRLSGRISSSRFTQRALPWERAKERLHVHETEPPAEARRRRGSWLMPPRLGVSAGESSPANVPQRAMPLERAKERLQAHEANPPAEARRRRGS